MIQINIPMPNRCYDCPFIAVKPFSADRRCVVTHYKQIDTPIMSKPAWCELKEVRKDRETE